MKDKIKGRCPKCGKEGTQRIEIKNGKPYLRYYHTRIARCYIGRGRSFEEIMGTINKPKTKEDYQKIINEIIAYTNSLLQKRYGHAGPQIRRELRTILESYGLWKNG